MHAAIERCDDDRMSFAELWREVAALADELGLTRPSYTHVRRRALVTREVREARRTVAAMLRRGEHH